MSFNGFGGLSGASRRPPGASRAPLGAFLGPKRRPSDAGQCWAIPAALVAFLDHFGSRLGHPGGLGARQGGVGAPREPPEGGHARNSLRHGGGLGPLVQCIFVQEDAQCHATMLLAVCTATRRTAGWSQGSSQGQQELPWPMVIRVGQFLGQKSIEIPASLSVAHLISSSRLGSKSVVLSPVDCGTPAAHGHLVVGPARRTVKSSANSVFDDSM